MANAASPSLSEPIKTSPKTWREHIRATLTLGVPLVGSQLGGMLMNTTDTVMLGWYGIEELAAGALATQFWFTVMMFGAGFAYAVVPMAAEAEGRGDVRQVRRSVRMGLWVCAAFVALVMPILWFSEAIFLALGQEAVVAELGGQYMRIAQWAMVTTLLWWALRGFLTAIERTMFVFWITLVGVFVNIGLNWLFIFGNWGMPELGIRGAAIATLGTNLVIFAAIGVYCAVEPRARPYEIFVRFWNPDWEAFGRVFRLGLPISMMITAETGLFIFSSIFMGWLGVVALAGHGIVLQIASLAFMVPMGMAQAATARVGLFHGRRDLPNVNRAAMSVMAVCLAFATISGLVFLALPEMLVSLFLDETNRDALTVLAYAAPLLFFAACFQLTDSAQAIGAANLRGLQDTRIPMIIAIVSYWPIGLGASYVLAFPLGWGGQGVWAGLALGLGVAAVLLNWRFFALSRQDYELQVSVTNAE
ncbi:MAG: MATE family efflux transporter [Pseudomonadota bacterium]